MARPQKCRKVCTPPKMRGFKPFGMPKCEIEQVTLKIEECESIKLINYDLHSQEEAAKMMNISRPTFTRMYNKALRIIVKAFVEGKAILIEGGNYQLEKDWFRCEKCQKLIEGSESHTKCKDCKLSVTEELPGFNQNISNQ